MSRNTSISREVSCPSDLRSATWACDEMVAGKWDKQIQTELEEADIIVYMVSHNFMSSEYIMEKEEIGIKTANTLFNKHAGMLGISGISSDMREIEMAAKN